MQIIVKGSESRKGFFPHLNRSIGKYIHTKEQYKEEMKRGGYVPTPENHQDPKPKPYKLSKWGKDMVSHINSVTDKDGKAHVSATFRRELEKKGGYLVNPERRVKLGRVSTQKGGFV